MNLILLSKIFVLSVLFSISLCEVIANRDNPSQNEKGAALKLMSTIGMKSTIPNGTGTGFAVSPDGHILTAHHVVENADEISVVFKNKRPQLAKVMTVHKGLDIAVLKIRETPTGFININKNSPDVGDEVFTIGYPAPELLGFNQKFTNGTVSSLTGMKNAPHSMQISVPVQPGNSGGPLISGETGYVVGIITHTVNHRKLEFNPQNINYAVKSSYALSLLNTTGVNVSSISLGEQQLLSQNKSSATLNNGSSIYSFIGQTDRQTNTKKKKFSTDKVSSATCLIVSGVFQ
ncbi:MAG: trypsin-like peptidase domain-containing protein [Deltaproteobacteria bacterium]|nr:trypsin-like peptidase domain-containing protein [Deltaproteobacteria bacterium]